MKNQQIKVARGSCARRMVRAAAAFVAVAAMSCMALCQDVVIAYVVPEGTVGNQDFGGVLGMDFDVNNPIIITKLGVFDDGSNGLNLPITARLWDRATQTELVSLDFTPEDQGELIGGSRFKPLPTPLELGIGFQGTITAEGYGASERLRNRLANPANIVWTTQDGNGSIAFVGSSRWGLTPGAFPDTVDQGPAARYAAGTFEFKTTPPLLPGKPTLSLKPGNQQVVLTWPPVTAPLPAASYRVFRAMDPGGPFAQIAETDAASYVDTNLANGVQVWYFVRAVSATGKAGPDSDVKWAVPYVLPEKHAIAYFTPMASGNQAFGGSLGLDFDLDNPIIVKQLGVFDDGADGLKLYITARIFDRETQTILAEVYFAPGEGELIDGMRFKPLDQPLRLEAGFKGVIQADGYGPEERLLNSNGNTNLIIWTLNDGNGSIRFVGSSRYGINPGTFPDVIDAGPAARFAAGTFEYEILPPERPGTPSLSVLQPYEDAAVTLSWTAVTKPLPAAKYRVFRASDPAGPYTLVAETTETGYRDSAVQNGTEWFYTVRAVAAGSEEGFDSNVVSSTPNPRLPGVAYVVSPWIAAAGTYGGSLGMDFDVARPVRVTELGVYDDQADGLFLTLTAALYNRETGELLASIVFTADDPGTLRDSSRFKPLAQPIDLPAGFKGVIAAWGYGAEERYFSNAQDLPDLKMFSGGSLLFVGSGRYGIAGQFPETPDAGPPNRYAAGTFYFEPLPEESSIAASISGAKIKLTWTGNGKLESAPEITGPWTEVAGATSGVELGIDGPRRFFRVRQ
ncbi:MAG: hypothetical protein QHJ82_02355 [Verrucomicrobiota bacterium]|nr:hypothetical protein [Verrucomicrobiota bacterium]